MDTFVCISHSGELELKTAFLVYSLKKYLRDNYKIYVCIPQSTHGISEPSIKSFELFHNLNVQICFFNNPLLNKRNNLLRGDLIGNKIYALMQDFDGDFIVFLDSDIVALKDFRLPIGINDLILKTADRAHITAWEKIYYSVGQNLPLEKFKTSLDKCETYPYFNSGVIGIRKKLIKEFSYTWAKYFEYLWDELIMNNLMIPSFHRDQVALSLAINELKYKYVLLHEDYNFPIRGKGLNKKMKPSLIHYHHPYTIYLSNLLLLEFQEFLKEWPEFHDLVQQFRPWKNLFGSNYFVAALTGLKGYLGYKRSIILQKL